MQILKKLATQTAIYGLSSVIGRLLYYLLVPLHTRLFLPNQYGVVTELYAYIGFFNVLATYGLETAFFRYIKDANYKQQVYGTAFKSIVVSSMILFLATYFFAPTIAQALHYPKHIEYIYWFALILIADTLTALPFAYLRYLEKAKRFAAIKVANIGINVTLNVLFLLVFPKIALNYPLPISIYNASTGVGYIFISNLVASLATVLLLLPEIKIALTQAFDKQLWKKMIQYSMPLLLVGLAGVVNEMLDRLLLKHFLPFDDLTNQSMLGIYGACYKISILMSLFTQAFRMAAEPFFFSQAQQKNAPMVYAQSMQYFVAIGGFIFAGVTTFIDVCKHFVGNKYYEGLGVVPILLLANLCLGIYYNLSIWYKITDKTKVGAIISMCGAAITLILNICTIPYFGYWGSAWATLICYAVMMLLSYIWGQKYYYIPYNIKQISIYILFAIGIYLLDNISKQFIYNNLPIFGVYLCKILLLCIYVTYVYRTLLLKKQV